MCVVINDIFQRAKYHVPEESICNSRIADLGCSRLPCRDLAFRSKRSIIEAKLCTTTLRIRADDELNSELFRCIYRPAPEAGTAIFFFGGGVRIRSSRLVSYSRRSGEDIGGEERVKLINSG